jgi:hypothetical protein
VGADGGTEDDGGHHDREGRTPPALHSAKCSASRKWKRGKVESGKVSQAQKSAQYAGIAKETK